MQLILYFLSSKLKLTKQQRDAPSQPGQLALGDALLETCINGAVEHAKLMLEDNRVDPVANNNEAISKVIRGGQVQVVKLLWLIHVLTLPRVFVP
jgi:hypothetical protein